MMPMKKIVLLILMLVSVVLSAADWQELSTKLEQSVWASSTFCEQIRGKQICYPPEQLFDDDPGTCWVEAAPGDGVGQWILFAVNRPVRKLSLINGFARSPVLYENNSRIKRARLSFMVGFTAPGLVTELDYYQYFLSDMKHVELDVQDTADAQALGFTVDYEEHERLTEQALKQFAAAYPFFMREIEKDLGFEAEMDPEQLARNRDLIFEVFGISCLRLEILEVYAGQRCEDTCVSEIRVHLE